MDREPSKQDREPSKQDEREVRAGRNQALFRVVNEQIKELNEAVATLTGSFAITCECADTNCIETIEIPREEYRTIRAQPRHFAVLPGHVYPDVERVARESDGFVVVEKQAAAAEVAEASDPRRSE
jgi:hypothetical protein